MTWLPISLVVERVDIGETTVRRYIRDYKEFIKTKKEGNTLVIHKSALDVMQKIKRLSVGKRLGKERIREELRANFSQEIIIGEDNATNDITVGQTLEEIRNLTTVIKKLVDENKQLKVDLADLDKKIDSIAIQQAEQNKLLSFTQDDNKSKGWFSWLRRSK